MTRVNWYRSWSETIKIEWGRTESQFRISERVSRKSSTDCCVPIKSLNAKINIRLIESLEAVFGDLLWLGQKQYQVHRVRSYVGLALELHALTDSPLIEVSLA